MGARMHTKLSMNIIKAHNLACPIDGKPIVQTDKQFVCENGHTYDIARQGHVNLLPVHFKRSRQPGDNKAMINARQSKGKYTITTTPEFANEMVKTIAKKNRLYL